MAFIDRAPYGLLNEIRRLSMNLPASREIHYPFHAMAQIAQAVGSQNRTGKPFLLVFQQQRVARPLCEPT